MRRDRIAALLATLCNGFQDEMRSELLAAGLRHLVERDGAGNITFRDVVTGEVLTAEEYRARQSREE